jgi:hypothetical protein
LRSARIILNTFDGGVSRLHGFKSQRGADYPFQFAMIAFNHVVPVLNLSVFNVRRAPAFAFEQSKRATIGGRFIRVDGEHEKPRGSHRMMPSTGVKITTIIS